MIKKFILFLLIFLLPTFCFCEEKLKQIELIFSLNSDIKSPKGLASIYFKKRLEDLTKNAVVVKIYVNSELYKDSNVLSALKIDKVNIVAPSFSKFLQDIPQLNIFELPFLFLDLTHIYSVLNSQVGKNIIDKAYEKGYIILGFWDKGFKQITTNSKPIIYPKDLEKARIRIRGLRVLNKVYRAFGAYPKVLPYNVVYKKLKENEIDGQENTITEIYNMQFYKRQKYLTILNHGYLGYIVVMNKNFWNSLPKFVKDAIVTAMNEATLKQRLYAKSLEDSSLNRIKNYAKQSSELSIVEDLSDKQKDEWFNKSKKIYELFYDEEDIGKNLIEKTLELR